MVERGEGMAFAAGAMVFPGGRVDEDDRALAGGDMERAARIAAIRETIEETAIPAGLSPLPDPDDCVAIRKALIQGERFSLLLDRFVLKLDLDALVPFARWVPQFHAVRRFDTWFFVAKAAGPAREPVAEGSECASAGWFAADEVLDRDRRGEVRLIFPTRRNLERLARHPDFRAIEEDCASHPVTPITPRKETIGGEEFVTIPEGIGYPVTREKLDGLWRG